MLELKQLLGKGILMCWLAIVLTSLFMILLFTPQGTNFIATGIIIGGIGLLVLGLGQGMGTISSVVKETLGREIAQQGLYIGGYGLLLTVIGIWQLIAKKKPVVTDVAKKVEPATVPAKSSTQAKAG